MARARHLSVGSVIEKNKIASENLFLILIKVLVKDINGVEVATLTFVKNSENVVYKEDTYQAANFEIDVSVQNNTEPTIKLIAQDQTRAIMQYMEAYAGCVGSEIVMTVINSGDINGEPELQEKFKITSSSNSGYVVSFDLGTESSVSKRFPAYRQFRDRCSWKFKGPRCKYSGSSNSCDFTLLGDNGCVFHNNAINFGGWPGLNA